MLAPRQYFEPFFPPFLALFQAPLLAGTMKPFKGTGLFTFLEAELCSLYVLLFFFFIDVTLSFLSNEARARGFYIGLSCISPLCPGYRP